jgi:CheY-like chemotaxis protein
MLLHALEHFQPDLYHLVLLDIIMPKMDGFELYKQIKKVEYCALDIDLFIRKPISTIGLIREINARIKVT